MTKRLLKNPIIYAFVIGLIIFVFSVKLPFFIKSALTEISKGISLLSMTVMGAFLAKCSLKDLFADYTLYIAAFFRLILIPLATYVILSLIAVDDSLLNIAVILSSLPVPVLGVILASQNDLNPKYASSSVFVSTALSTITVPVVATLLQMK